MYRQIDRCTVTTVHCRTPAHGTGCIYISTGAVLHGLPAGPDIPRHPAMAGRTGDGDPLPTLGTAKPGTGTPPKPNLGGSHARTGGAPRGAAAVGRPTKVPCSPVSGRIWVAHFVWENRPVHGPPNTKRPPRQRPPDPGATEPATGGRRWSESICGSEDGRGPLPPRRGLESTPTQLGIHPSSPLPVRRTLGRALTLRGTAGSLRRTGLRGFRAPRLFFFPARPAVSL